MIWSIDLNQEILKAQSQSVSSTIPTYLMSISSEGWCYNYKYDDLSLSLYEPSKPAVARGNYKTKQVTIKSAVCCQSSAAPDQTMARKWQKSKRARGTIKVSNHRYWLYSAQLRALGTSAHYPATLSRLVTKCPEYLQNTYRWCQYQVNIPECRHWL